MPTQKEKTPANGILGYFKKVEHEEKIDYFQEEKTSISTESKSFELFNSSSNSNNPNCLVKKLNVNNENGAQKGVDHNMISLENKQTKYHSIFSPKSSNKVVHSLESPKTNEITPKALRNMLLKEEAACNTSSKKLHFNVMSPKQMKDVLDSCEDFTDRESSKLKSCKSNKKKSFKKKKPTAKRIIESDDDEISISVHDKSLGVKQLKSLKRCETENEVYNESSSETETPKKLRTANQKLKFSFMSPKQMTDVLNSCEDVPILSTPKRKKKGKGKFNNNDKKKDVEINESDKANNKTEKKIKVFDNNEVNTKNPFLFMMSTRHKQDELYSPSTGNDTILENIDHKLENAISLDESKVLKDEEEIKSPNAFTLMMSSSNKKKCVSDLQLHSPIAGELNDSFSPKSLNISKKEIKCKKRKLNLSSPGASVTENLDISTAESLNLYKQDALDSKRNKLSLSKSHKTLLKNYPEPSDNDSKLEKNSPVTQYLNIEHESKLETEDHASDDEYLPSESEDPPVEEIKPTKSITSFFKKVTKEEKIKDRDRKLSKITVDVELHASNEGEKIVNKKSLIKSALPEQIKKIESKKKNNKRQKKKNIAKEFDKIELLDQVEIVENNSNLLSNTQKSEDVLNFKLQQNLSNKKTCITSTLENSNKDVKLINIKNEPEKEQHIITTKVDSDFNIDKVDENIQTPKKCEEDLKVSTPDKSENFCFAVDGLIHQLTPLYTRSSRRATVNKENEVENIVVSSK